MTDDAARGRRRIVRRELVRAHNPVFREWHPTNTLTVGNVDFALTVDLSGLQTFPEAHRLLPDPDRVVTDGSRGLPHQKRRTFDRDHFQIPLRTQASWGWYRTRGERQYAREEADVVYDTPRGAVAYPSKMGILRAGDAIPDDMAGAAWHTFNPRRLHLGRLALAHDAEPGLFSNPGVLENPHTELDLWTGTVRAEFGLRGKDVSVETIAHADLAQVATLVRSDLLSTGLAVAWVFDPQADDLAWFEQPLDEEVSWDQVDSRYWVGRCRVETSEFTVEIRTDGVLTSADGGRRVVASAATGADSLELVVTLRPAEDGPHLSVPFDPPEDEARTPGYTAVSAAGHESWKRFWMSGAAVSMAGSSDPAARELERRIVLSQYLTAVNCAGSTPPAETGLTYNTWTGKFHLEMHWWHAAHFPLWGRGALLERSLNWYHDVLDQARETAQRQGYRGARWPKQTDPSGVESPSSIGVFLLWQQPHIIHLLELLVAEGRPGSFLERHYPLVEATAEFMADFAEERDGAYILPPPIIPAQESYLVHRTTNENPTFELAYWSWALGVANRWRERLGMEARAEWRDVSERMQKPAIMSDGSYAAISTPPYLIREDHPSTLMAMGWLPDTPLIEVDTMDRTLAAVWDDWSLPTTWGWDYPVMAMTAARLGRLDLAFDALMLPSPKNVFLPNGHNPQIRGFLTLYLPANGGLLAAVAHVVAAIERGSSVPAGWQIEAEGFSVWPPVP